ncbi:hypothetical protein [Nonomuraea sp. NPDC050310]|uniref:hypothetical protein n=1 Tax=Nonomuraea sp. NPDC050310 TaxID=3154935 RepID=UPI0033C19E33
MPPTRTRLALSLLTLVPVLPLAGCAEPLREGPLPGPDDGPPTTAYVELCVTVPALVRAPDQRCDDERPGHAWSFVATGRPVPAVGRKAATGVLREPSDAKPAFYRAPPEGGDGETELVLRPASVVEVCVRKATRVRVQERHCVQQDSKHAWYDLGLDRQIPPMGAKAARGSFRRTAYAVTYRAPAEGGEGSEVAFAPAPKPPATGSP